MLSAWLSFLLFVFSINLPQPGAAEAFGNTFLSARPIVRSYQSNIEGVKLTAQAAAAVDLASGQYLYAYNIDKVRPIASLTKLMTALVFLENNPGWDKEVVMGRADEVSKAKYIYRGEKVRVKDLFFVSLIASDNNATMALARSTGLSRDEFIAIMNNKAKELGLADTKFEDITGLSENNVSTVRDLIKLGMVVWQNPDIIAATSQQRYLLSVGGRQRTVISTNKMFNNFIQVKAAKTGYTEEAGYCFFARVAGDQGDILSIALGSDSEESRFQDVKVLSWWVLNNFIWPST